MTLLTLALFTSCDEYKNSAEKSGITYLPRIEVLGDAEVELTCDATGYVDDGAEAFEGEDAIDVDTEIHGRYFGSTAVDAPDYYDITYSAVNVDGIPGAATRAVVWPACNGDLVTSIEGMYTAAVFRTQPSSGATVDYSSESFGPYWIVDLGGGEYGFSCVIGQFYEYGYGYGSHYAGTGFTVQANDIATNDFTVTGSNGVGDFGGTVDVSNITVDAGAGTISFTTTWSFGYEFDVVLTQAAE